MLGARTLLFTTLAALGGWLLLGGEAAATTPADAKGGPKLPSPKPTGTTAQAAQQGGIDCQTSFQRWKALADRAAVLCAEAAQAADVWWQWEELRLAGAANYDAQAQERARVRWDEAGDNCDDINSTSLAAMAEYEACMLAQGLNPALPSGATS